MKNRFKLQHLQVTMPAGGEEQARTFYGTILGLPEIAKPPELQERGGLWFELGSVELHIGIEEEPSEKRGHLGLLASNLIALRKRLSLNRCSIEEALPVSKYERFYSRDPFGNRIEFMSIRRARKRSKR